MEFMGRRSSNAATTTTNGGGGGGSGVGGNYVLLSQFPLEDDQQPSPSKFDPPSSSSADKNRHKPSSPFDWAMLPSDVCLSGFAVDHRVPRIGGPPLVPPLQRQSSGSSYGESSLSGDYLFPATLSSVTAAGDPDGFGNPIAGGSDGVEVVGDGRVKEAVGSGAVALGSSSQSASKSWAQQAEETYQLQLALALRLCSEATCADDPNFLEPSDRALASSTASADSMSHRFWVNGCLSYYDKVPDGFYMIEGMDPYMWTLCTDTREENWIPAIESLKNVSPGDSSIEVIVIDKQNDTDLREFQNMIVGLSCSCTTTKDVVDHLSKLVCARMGGTASSEEHNLVHRWKECSEALRASSGSVVLPIGKLSAGLCRHRALMFKMLADAIDLPCRIAKGCRYCKCNNASSCLVRFDLNREYLVDLIGNPGSLSDPDSVLNGLSSISICSPLRSPHLRSSQIPENFRSLAKQFLEDCQSLNLIFTDSPGGNPGGPRDAASVSKDHDVKYAEPNPMSCITGSEATPPLLPNVARLLDSDEGSQLKKMQNPLQSVTSSQHVVKESIQLKSLLEDGHDLNIPWKDLVLKERIGAGSFGTVHRADWHGSDVAVKILMDQDFHPEHLKEFLREVVIMKSLRHPNIVLFMGAVTQPPNLSIVTEYLSRGSLYRFLHRPGASDVLDGRRRLNMAYDVAKGMNYLHRRDPPVVHRDLKSPNLLVDKKYTVKVSDFGLSRLKANTFLSSKSAAGTPEWMAPEVLRDELSNEKSDIYSFGVILWEIMTLQQPWSNLNPAQVVAAVGFRNRRLEIPSDMNPRVASLIESCWANEPWKRPSFSSIMESLKPLIKPLTPQPAHAD